MKRVLRRKELIRADTAETDLPLTDEASGAETGLPPIDTELEELPDAADADEIEQDVETIEPEIQQEDETEAEIQAPETTEPEDEQKGETEEDTSRRRGKQISMMSRRVRPTRMLPTQTKKLRKKKPNKVFIGNTAFAGDGKIQVLSPQKLKVCTLVNTVDVLLEQEDRFALSRLIESGRIEENSITTRLTATLMSDRTPLELVGRMLCDGSIRNLSLPRGTAAKLADVL